MKEALDHLVERLDGLAPATALVLGSGLGGLVDQVKDAVRISYAELPGFPRSGVTGHAGEVVAGRFAGTPVLMLSGRAHYYEHGNAAAMRPALEVLAGLGISQLILTNAAGSVDPDMGPGSVMLITDHINFSGSNPLIGEPSDRRFVGLTEAYDAGLRSAIETAAKATATALVFRAVLRDARRDPHGTRHGRQCRRHVDGAGGHSRPLPRPARRRLLGNHQPCSRDDRGGAFAPGDQGHGAGRRCAAGDHSPACVPGRVAGE
jgi:hypothetical protein